jgi:hypothetical protein
MREERYSRIQFSSFVFFDEGIELCEQILNDFSDVLMASGSPDGIILTQQCFFLLLCTHIRG